MNDSVHMIVGATGGIGRALTKQLAESGARLAVAARGEAALRELAASCSASVHAFDARDAAAFERAVAEAAEAHSRLDGLALCVGSILLKPAHRTEPDEWREVLAQNLDTAFHAVRAGAKVMQSSGGSIVLVSSAAAQVGLPNHEAIAAAKAGVIGLARAAAASYAPRGLRVNVVAPGLVRTPLAAPLLSSPSREEVSIAMHPLRRLGEPEDVARAIAWFLDPAQSWVTGQVLGVDGGLATLRSR